MHVLRGSVVNMMKWTKTVLTAGKLPIEISAYLGFEIPVTNDYEETPRVPEMKWRVQQNEKGVSR